MGAIQPLVSVQLLTWNSRRYLAACLQSVRVQTYQPLEVLVVDNASTDGSLDIVRQQFPQFRVLQTGANLGYSGGHNAGIPHTRGEYVILLNPDIVLAPTFVAEMVAALAANPGAGSASGKLYRYDADRETVTKTLDSTGVALTRSRRYYDRGQGEDDHGQYDHAVAILGPSGAAPCYRRAALDDVRHAHGEYFDNDFFAYLEDIDLAWRLAARGWISRFVPTATAGHVRNLTSKQGRGLAAFRANRRQQSLRLRRLSTRNHYWLFLKNERWPHLLRDLPFLVTRETLLLGYQLVFEPATLTSLFAALARLPRMLRKRRRILRTRRASWKAIAALFTADRRIL